MRLNQQASNNPTLIRNTKRIPMIEEQDIDKQTSPAEEVDHLQDRDTSDQHDDADQSVESPVRWPARSEESPARHRNR
jgi:hypothetical protein